MAKDDKLPIEKEKVPQVAKDDPIDEVEEVILDEVTVDDSKPIREIEPVKLNTFFGHESKNDKASKSKTTILLNLGP